MLFSRQELTEQFQCDVPPPPNVRNHWAAASDCPFENDRLRGSGALHDYVRFICQVRMPERRVQNDWFPFRKNWQAFAAAFRSSRS